MTVSINSFASYTKLKDSNGQYWIDQTTGSDTPPVWCPNQVIDYSFFNFADHNGIYQFQFMSGKPGDEDNSKFQAFTVWRSINNDPHTIYYDSDGVTPLKPGVCKDGQAWGANIPHCKDFNLYKSNFTIPNSLPAGPAILRWLWYGAMTVDGKRVVGPEPSLFANCKDVIIGTSQQCK